MFEGMTHTGTLSLQTHVFKMGRSLRVHRRMLHRFQTKPPARLDRHLWAAPSRVSMSGCRDAPSSSLRASDGTPTFPESISDREKVSDLGSEEQQQPPQQNQGLEQVQEEQQQLQDAQDQQLQHGPGFCACCRLPGINEPIVHVVTYVNGVVLEVETADGDVVYFDQDEEDDGPGGYRPLSGRRLLEKNPDFPSQRESNPSWVNGGGSPQFQVQSQNQDEQQLGGSSGAPSSDNAGSPVVASNPIVIFSGGQFGASWHDSTYGADPFTSYQPAGKDSGTASCHYLPKGSAKSFYGPQGAFNGQKALEFWAYAGSSGVADVDLLLSGAAQCRRLPLRSLSIAESSSGWVKFWVDLNLFSWVQPGGGAFSGCGTDGTSAGDLVKLDFFNSHAEYKALLCIDNVRLVP